MRTTRQRLNDVESRHRFLRTRCLCRGELSETLTNIYLAYLPPDTQPDEVIRRLRLDRDIAWAEPDYYRHTTFTEPNDLRYLHEISERAHLDRIKAQNAWDTTTGDPNIIIAVIDTGVFYNHPDLFSNIWVNPGEVSDNDGDRRLDLCDIDLDGDRYISEDEFAAASNGIDDDGNGYVDDVIGWDFVDSVETNGHPGEDYAVPDNNPNDVQGHGTLVAGTAAAVGNNGIGVTGVTWNARIMVLRAGYMGNDGNGTLITDAVGDAIRYAVDQGADIVNMSFGGYIPCRYEYAALEYARDNACLLIASAGNDNTDELHYPSAYEEVIAVAATFSTNDKRANQLPAWASNYGLSIDVAAPGIGIGTTSRDGWYGLAGGTSLSSPIVAGVAALVRSVHTTLDYQETINQVIATCDDIDAINPLFSGRLGAGRVNAHKAVTKVFFGPRPEIVGQIAQYVEGESEAGKRRVALYVTLRNFGHPWGQITTTLTSTDPHVTVANNSTAQHEKIHSQRRSTNSAAPHVIYIDEDIPSPYDAAFELDIQVNGITIARERFTVCLSPFDVSLLAERPAVILREGGITADRVTLVTDWLIPDSYQIDDYSYGVGRVPGQADIRSWSPLPPSGLIDVNCIPLVPNQQYFLSVRPFYGNDAYVGFSAPVRYEPVYEKGSLRLSADEYSSSDTLDLTLSDRHLRGTGTYTIEVETDGGDREAVDLNELSNLGVFVGSLVTSGQPIAVRDGTLQGGHGRTLTVTYQDADDGRGRPQTVVQSATIDDRGPAISGVKANEVLWTEATVVFDTNEPACGTVHFGLSPDALNDIALGMCDPCHFTVRLTGLQPNTTYFCAAEARDVVGNAAIDDNHGNGYVFKTLPPVPHLFVDDDGPANGDGMGWDTACKYLQDALALAESLPKPLTVCIAEGTYLPDRSESDPDGSGRREAAFHLIEGVTLRGGYAGLNNRSNPDDRDMDMYPTVLSGDLRQDDNDVQNARDLIADSTRQNNAYHVVVGSGAPGDHTLDGLTVTGGHADGSGSLAKGGAVHNVGGGVAITKCVFVGNFAAQNGGAVYTADGVFEAIQCTFTGNASGFDGGALANHDSQVTLSHCILAGNSAVYWAGASLNYGSDVLVTNCTFANNMAGKSGGAMDGYGGSQILTNCILWGDTPQEISGISPTITFSFVAGGFNGQGNVDTSVHPDPLFADTQNGDYHLKSRAGRWDPGDHTWVVDPVSSPCIDRGSPSSDWSLEPEPNGDRINLGAYGGTTEASKSP